MRSVSFEKLYKVRDQLGPERRAFRQYMQELGMNVSKLPSVEAVRDFVVDERKHAKDVIRTQRELCRSLGVALLANVMSVSVPTAVAGRLAHASPITIATA